MNENDLKENMKIVRLVWIILNVLLVIYGTILFLYGRYFKKSEVLVYVN